MLISLPEAFFYEKDALHLAPALLGKLIKANGIVARITEVEAYMGHNDRACHAANGKRTKRNEVMFHRGGVFYVYLIYGIHHCVNIVSGAQGEGEAVLLRSVEILEGMDVAGINRFGKPFSALSAYQKKNMCNGPGKICQALGISSEYNGQPCFSGNITVCQAPDIPFNEIIKAPRIGVDYAGEDALLPWRFLL